MQYLKNNRRTISKEINSIESRSQYSSDIQRMLFALSPGTEVLFIEAVGNMGDILASIGSLRNFKERYTHLSLVFAIQEKFLPLIENNRFITRGFGYMFGMDTYDYAVVFDLSAICSEWESRNFPDITETRPEILNKYLELPEKEKYMSFYQVSENEKRVADQFLKERNLQDKKLVGIALKSAELYKDYPIEKYETVVRTFQDRQEVHFLIFDQSIEVTWPYKNYTSIYGLNIREVAALLQRCSCLITVDSGLLHLAGVLIIPIIFLYGISSWEARTKYYKAINISSKLDCIPCWRGKDQRCKKLSEKDIMHRSVCMEEIKVAEITEAILEIIDERGCTCFR